MDLEILASVLGACTGSEHGFFVHCFYQILLAICPFAVVALYLSITPENNFKERVRIAKTASWTAWSVMILTAIGGPTLLSSIGIKLEAFGIAGGLFLVVLGFRMLNSPDPEIASEKEIEGLLKAPKRKRIDAAIAPLGIPIIAGPSALTLVVVIEGQAQTWGDKFACLGAITAVIFLMYWMLYLTSRGARWLTPTVMKLCYRLSGLFLVAIGVQLAMDGIRATGLLSCAKVIS